MKILLKRHWPLLGLGALLLIVAFYLAKSGKELVKTTALLKDMVSGEGLKLEDIHYRQNDPEDKIKWVLDAEEVRLSEDKKVVRFYGFDLMVEPEARPGFKLSGKRGNYFKDSNQIELWGELKGLYGNDYQIFTEYLLVSDNFGRLSTDRPVRISGPFFTVKGQGLVADLPNETIRILSDVTTTLKGNPETP
ncbi:MAG: LPS export ABC transporter periplasmic protein LptC [Deltaproteobacteria bacterium]|nr:LPS export ABC transporter periplasmic protein LptC [Deltaproteobacteria bacterium]